MAFGLRAKIFFAITVVVVLTLGGALWLTKLRADRAADQSISRALDAAQVAIGDAMANRSRGLARSTATVSQVSTYVSRIDEAIRANDGAALFDQADEYRDLLDADWIMITDDLGVVRAWTLDPSVVGEDFSGGSLIDLPVFRSEVAEGIWIEPGADGVDVLYQAVGVPILDPGRTTTYGSVIAALVLDSAFLADLKTITTSDIAMFALDTLGRPVTAVSTVPRQGIADALASVDVLSFLSSAEASHEHVVLESNGEALIGAVGPLLTAAGDPLGGYIGFRSWQAELAVYTQLQNTIVIVFGVGLLMAVVASLGLARQITRPVTRLLEVTRNVREGQYTGSIDVRTRDEIGALASAFQAMVQELRAKDELVEYLSSSSSRTLAIATQATLVSPAGEGRATVTKQISIGEMLGDRYEIKELLGHGGMGVVYRALDHELQEQVAIKTLRAEALQYDASLIDRFKQEIRLARRITHRNVVRTHDLGEFDGMYYITMEFVEGTTLKELIEKRGKLPVGVSVTIGKQLCRALEVAHEEGVIHRDIKPQNLVVDPSGFLKVMDFGIARLAQRPKDSDSGLTAVGVAIGTPDYMAPEQIMGEDIDQRADLYALGAVLYECVAGAPVFAADNMHLLMAKHLETPPPDPRESNASVPESLAHIILKALAKEPSNRWNTAREVHAALERVEA